ncbi:MAG: hypothetical protein ACI80F_002175 [Natronomonas sp.]|jgi:hypothetical protein|uniref:hypothetical protein n=1 Tax=Natronomonas sp. TaxID=2184060 RepID=UPI0039898AF2
MDEAAVAQLRTIVAALAAVVAGIHLLHPSQGGAALLVYARVGYLGDPRPLLFTLGAFALVFALVLGSNGFAGRTLYLGGIVVTLAFLGGFLAWHTVFEHGGLWPYLEPNPHADENVLVVIGWHLLADPLVLVSKVTELALLGCLVTLYRAEG